MKKKVTVIGYGGQGGWHAAHALESDVVSLLGIYDIDEAKIKLAESRGIKTYGSLDDALSDPECDIVVVATPNDVHKEIVVKALEAGKNVICEKPVEMSVSAFDEMIAAKKKSGKLLSVHQNRRWDVDYLAMKNVIESGEIGEVIRIESRIHGSRGIPSDWRCHKPQGGGMILDWGVHLIDQMLMLIPDKIVKVQCDVTNITTDEVDDGFRLNLYFESGKTAYVEVGTFNFLPLPRFYMLCKGGSAKIEDWRQNCRVAKCLAWHESDVVPVQTAAAAAIEPAVITCRLTCRGSRPKARAVISPPLRTSSAGEHRSRRITDIIAAGRTSRTSPAVFPLKLPNVHTNIL